MRSHTQLLVQSAMMRHAMTSALYWPTLLQSILRERSLTILILKKCQSTIWLSMPLGMMTAGLIFIRCALLWACSILHSHHSSSPSNSSSSLGPMVNFAIQEHGGALEIGMEVILMKLEVSGWWCCSRVMERWECSNDSHCLTQIGCTHGGQLEYVWETLSAE